MEDLLKLATSTATSIGVVGVLMAIIYALNKGMFVTRREHDTRIADLTSQLNKADASTAEWKGIALKAVLNNERMQGTAEKATNLVEKATEKAADIARVVIESNRSTL